MNRRGESEALGIRGAIDCGQIPAIVATPDVRHGRWSLTSASNPRAARHQAGGCIGPDPVQVAVRRWSRGEACSCQMLWASRRPGRMRVIIHHDRSAQAR